MIGSISSNNALGFSTINQGANSNITINHFPPNTPTAGLSPYTDEEIKAKLWELARREVAQGNFAWSATSADECGSPNNAEYRRLMTYFQSNVAPDRVGAVNSQLNSMARSINLSAMQTNRNLTIFDMLIRSLGQNGRNPNVGVNFMLFTNGTNGSPIAKYMQGGGLMALFNEGDGELQRAGEFRLMFKEMKTQIKSKEGNTDSLINLKRSGHDVDLSLWSNPNTAFNMERLSANGITFDSETGQTSVDQAKLRQAVSQYESFSIPQ